MKNEKLENEADYVFKKWRFYKNDPKDAEALKILERAGHKQGELGKLAFLMFARQCGLADMSPEALKHFCKYLKSAVENGTFPIPALSEAPIIVDEAKIAKAVSKPVEDTFAESKVAEDTAEAVSEPADDKVLLSDEPAKTEASITEVTLSKEEPSEERGTSSAFHAVMDEYETDDEGMDILGAAFGITKS